MMEHGGVAICPADGWVAVFDYDAFKEDCLVACWVVYDPDAPEGMMVSSDAGKLVRCEAESNFVGYRYTGRRCND